MPASVTTATVAPPADVSKRNGKKMQVVVEGKEEQASPSHEGNNTSQDDFFWTYTEEPHKTRRQAIIKAHPEVRAALANT